MDGQTPRTSWKRRLVRALAVGLIGSVALVAVAPWLLALPAARSAAVKAANRALAPSRVHFTGLSASWFRSVRLSGLTLRNAQGKTLIAARTATLDRGLLALALHPTRLGIITVDGAAVDIERRADGSIDLVEALVPPDPRPKPQPKAARGPAAGKGGGIDVTLRVTRSSLTLRSPELAGPLVARRMELQVRVPAAAGQPLTWRLRLAEPEGGVAEETLGLDGTFDHRAAADPDQSLTVQARRWPVSLTGAPFAADAAATTRLDGQLRLERRSGRWLTGGDTRLLDLDASGAALRGDRLRLDQVAVAWDVEQTEAAWSVRQAKLKSPVADLYARGETATADHGPTARIEGTINLAALAAQAPHLLHVREGLTLERGTARVTADVKSAGADRSANVEAWLTDLAAHNKARSFTLRDPASLSARGTLSPTGLSVQNLVVKANGVDIKGSGDLEKGLVLNGSADLGALQSQFKDLIDFGAVSLEGKVRMAGDYRRNATPKGITYVARYAAEARGLKLAGLTAGPQSRDTARFDVAASGPADASGFPLGWSNARVNLKSSRDSATVSATSRDGTVSVAGVVSVPLSASPVRLVDREGQLGLRVIGRWTAAPAVIEADELSVMLVPGDPALASGGGTVCLGVRGRYDLDADTLTLAPVPVPPRETTTLALAPEGLTIRGVRAATLTERAGKLRLVGDLAAIDRARSVWSGAEPTGLAGSLSVEAALASGGPGRLLLGAQVKVPDLSRPGPGGKGRKAEGALALTLRGAYEPGPDRLTFDEVDASTPYASLQATGRLDEPGGRLVADLSGTLSPAWPRLSALAADMVEPGLKLAGGPRPFHVKGPLSGTSTAAILKGLDAELGLDLASADAFGLKLGPAPIVVRCGNGGVTIDPVSTTLNGGRLELKPGLDADEARGIALTLAKGSNARNVAINDEVSRRLLRYVAPVLDKATHVNGTVSLDVERGEFPLTGPPDRHVNLTGQLAFQDVVFAPGPFATEMLTLVGKPDSPGLKLQQPVQLTIADGKVVQKGLQIPIQRDVVVGLDGAVGFDESLDLKARIPVTRALLGPAAGLDKALSGNTITVPIGGTVQHPRVNRQALQVALKELSKGAVQRELKSRASGLLDRVAPPPAAGTAGTNPPQPADAIKGLEDQLFRRLGPKRRDPKP